MNSVHCTPARSTSGTHSDTAKSYRASIHPPPQRRHHSAVQLIGTQRRQYRDAILLDSIPLGGICSGAMMWGCRTEEVLVQNRPV